MARILRAPSEAPEPELDEDGNVVEVVDPVQYGRIYVKEPVVEEPAEPESEADAEVVTEPAQADDEAVVVEEPAEPAPAARGKRSK